MGLKYLKSKFFCVFLIFVFLLQSCTVYQKTPVSIEEATATNDKVLVLRTNDTKLKLRKIEQIDGQYFGILKVYGKEVKSPISEGEIKTIRVLDKSTSTLLTVGAVIIPVGIIILISTIDWSLGPSGFVVE